MPEDTKPTATDPLNGSPTDGGGTDPQGGAAKPDETLEFLKGVMGRDFKDIEDATKSLENLKSMVGDNAIAELRRKAEESDKLTSTLSELTKLEEVNEDSLKEYLEGLTNTNKTMEQNTDTPATDEATLQKIKELEGRFEKEDFLKSNPDAQFVIDKVQMIANSTGKKLSEVYNDEWKDVATALKAKAEEAKKDSTTADPSANATGSETIDPELVNSVRKGNATQSQKEALVEKYLKIGK